MNSLTMLHEGLLRVAVDFRAEADLIVRTRLLPVSIDRRHDPHATREGARVFAISAGTRPTP